MSEKYTALDVNSIEQEAFFFSTLSVQERPMSEFKFKLVVITSQMKALFELTPTRCEL